MNIRDLKYLIAVADRKHFGKAARECFISQPALSMQIKKLENELGVKVFERDNKKLLITEVGERIIEKAREVLYQVNVLKEIAKESQDPFAGSIALGMIPTLGPFLLPLIMPALNSLFPNLNFNLFEDKTDNLIAALEEGKLDAALVSLPILNPHFIAVPIFEEEFFAAISKQAIFPKKRLQLSDLEDKELILLDEGHCLREQALSVCQANQAVVTNSFKSDQFANLETYDRYF